MTGKEILSARNAITRGKVPSFFVVNGHDLMIILSDDRSPWNAASISQEELVRS